MFLLKSQYNKNNDIRFLKPAYRLANVLGIAPCYDFEQNVEHRQLWYRIYGIVNMMALLAIYFDFMSMGIGKLMYEMKRTEVFVDNLEYLLITFFNLVTIFGSVTYNRKQWPLLFKTFNDFDKCLNRRFEKNRGNWFPLQFIAFNVVISFVFLLEILLWFNYSMETYVHYMLPRLQMYYIFLTAFIITVISRSILTRYRYFNEFFESERQQLKIVQIKLHTLLDFALDDILTLYQHLNSLIDCFNNIFGWIILIFYGVAIMVCLECINLLITSVFNYDVNSLAEDYYLIIPVTLFALMFMISGFLILIFCDYVNEESHKTYKICYQILLEGNCSSTRIYLHRFEIFTEYIASKRSPVVAGGVFKLRRQLLLNFISTLTTYVIVIVTFHGRH